MNTRARRYTEETRLGVDGVQSSVVAKLHPADIVTDCFHFPARNSGDQHGKVRLAASAGKCASHIV